MGTGTLRGVARSAVGVVPLVLVPALGAVQGGFQPHAWVWAGALAAWAGALAVVLTDDPGGLRRAWPWLVAASTLLAWTIVSALWSVRLAQSVLEARRMVVYAATVLTLVVLARTDATRVLVAATNVAVSGLVLYALARYLFGVRHIEFEGYLLSQPLGYANAVGILAVIGILLGIGIASGSGSRLAGVGAAATVPLLALALELSGSDASWLALAVGLATMVVLQPAPRRLLRVAAALVPLSALLAWLGHHSGLAAAGTSPPRLAGALVALVAAGCAAVAAAVAAWLHEPEGLGWSLRRRIVAVAVVVCVAAVGALVVGRAGARQPRSSYFHVAWHDQYRAHPLFGSGAGTFGHYWERSGLIPRWGGALDAHSLYLETLAELGPLGLLLLLAFLLFPLRDAVARRRVPYVPAATGAYAAFLVHAGLDWDWELPAVVVAGLACGAAVLLDTGGQDRRLHRAARVAVLVIALALGASAIAGARSRTEPSAALRTTKAPQGGTFVNPVSVRVGYLPWWPWSWPPLPLP